MTLVAPSCEGDTWVCPAGTQRYDAPWREQTCLPLMVQGDGRSNVIDEAPLSVPIDGVCTWVFPAGSDPKILSAVPVGNSCTSLGQPFALTTAPAASDYLSLQASFFDAQNRVRVLARGWTFDANITFGVRSDGVGLGLVPGHAIQVATPWLFDNTLDLGDAALVETGFLYAYGCPGAPQWLEEDCNVGRAPLARIDESSAWSVLGEGGWGVGKPLRVFGSGPHRGPVVHDPRGGFLHVYAIGFGSTVELTHADRPEGPWGEAKELVKCQLPVEDPGAYCAGPVVYLELFDPTQPSELVVGYSVGTTSADGEQRKKANPAAYWPRVVRTSR
jgi:hypothetical protein